jgi:hypothetical protein
MSTVLPLRINTNVNGIPRVSSQSVSVNTAGDTVSFDFQNHPTIGGPFVGWITIRLAQAIPTGTTTTLPIVFTSGGGNAITLTGFNGDAVTAADLPGTGIYLVWYESQTRTLQLLTGIV